MFDLHTPAAIGCMAVLAGLGIGGIVGQVVTDNWSRPPAEVRAVRTAQYAADAATKIAKIDAELRSLGVEPHEIER
jgi:pyrimidine deaminase RibD-like protein